MAKFEIINSGVEGFDWLLNKYKNLEISKSSIQELKEEIYETFINNHFFDFTTKGGVSVTFFDLKKGAVCEIFYN